MKLTKLVHSCLLVEKDGTKILVDPGVYSWQDEKMKHFDLSGISAVVVTHNHPDHFNVDFANAVKQASPGAVWYGTQETSDSLKDIDVSGQTNGDDQNIRFIESKHADLSPWFNNQPLHTSYVIFDEILVSGDCQTLNGSNGARILAAAVNGGPWGAVVGFTKMIEAMSDRPKTVVPLHDWHWNEEARGAIYAKLPEVMERFGVNFIPLQNYETIEI